MSLSKTPAANTGDYSAAEIRRAWRMVTFAGMLGSTYYILCIFGAPRIKYLTELHASAFEFGLIAGLGSLAMAFQLVGGLFNNRLKRRRPIWMTAVIAHRLIFLLVLLAPLIHHVPLRMTWIILALLLHDVLANMMTPVWMSWMSDLVPHATANRHWASRQQLITAGNILVMLTLAFAFDFFEHAQRVIIGYTLIACIGVTLGVIDILLFVYVPEPAHTAAAAVRLREITLQPLRDAEFRPFLTWLAYWHFAVFLAAPFFGLYLIAELGYSVLTVQLLATASALGVTLSSKFWGLLFDTYGFRPVLKLVSIGKFFTPLTFFIIPGHAGFALPLFLLLYFMDGIVNAGFMLGVQGAMLKSTPRPNRAMYVAAANFLAVGICGGISPAISGQVIDMLNALPRLEIGIWTFSGFHAAFLLSCSLRTYGIALAGRIRDRKWVGLDEMLRQLLRPALPQVLRGLDVLNRSKDETARLAAARRLGELHHPLAISELIGALADPSLRLREAAAEALGRIGADEAVEPLARILRDPHSGLHSPAARALGGIGGAESLRALLANLANRDSVALAATVDALGRLNDSAAIVPLIVLFHDVQDKALREKIAAALGKLHQLDSAEIVMQMLQDRRAIPPTIRVTR